MAEKEVRNPDTSEKGARYLVRKTWLTRKIDSSAWQNAMIVTLALILGSSLSWTNAWGLKEVMAASGEAVSRGEYWRLWTSLFVHSDAGHLISNIFLFFILGAVLNNYFGALIFPVLAFLFGGLTNYLVLQEMPAQVRLVGASGVVFWLGGFWLVLYLLLDRRRTVRQRILRSLGVAIALFMPMEAFEPDISYRSHWYGFWIGAGFGLPYFFARKRAFRRAEVIEPVREEPEPEEPPQATEEPPEDWEDLDDDRVF